MKNLFTLLFLVAVITTSAQPVPSSCTGPDSIVQKYKTDAYRLAARRVHKINSTYKDTVRVNAAIRSDYQRALIAVYNATALPARDTVVRILNIHTKPDPELSTINIKAPSVLAWMNKLMNSITPTGDAQVDNLMGKYKLQPIGYFQSTNYDLAILKSDSSLNLVPLITAFKNINGVIDAEAAVTFNDEKEITDSINTAFTGLTYSFGWGSCENGCDMRAYWKFRVYSDCSVQYMGTSGDGLFAGISSSDKENPSVTLYPNPAQQKVTLNFPIRKEGSMRMQMFDPLGRILVDDPDVQPGELSLSQFAAGIYTLRFNSSAGTKTFKLIKQ